MDLNKLFDEDFSAKKDWKPKKVITPIIEKSILEYNSSKNDETPTLFRCSGIGSCDRRIVYETRHPELKGIKDAKSLFVVNVGTVIHELLQEYLNDKLKSLEQRVYYSDLLSGSYDGEFSAQITGDKEDSLLEIKTANVEVYQRFLLYPNTLYAKYKKQASAYLKALGLKRAYFVIVNKNGGLLSDFKKENVGKFTELEEVFLEIVYDLDEKYLEEIDEKIATRKYHIDVGTLPPRKKVSECNYCPFQSNGQCEEDHKQEKELKKKEKAESKNNKRK